MKSKISLVLAAVLVFAPLVSADAALSKKVIGNLVFWDQTRGFQVIQNNSDIFSGVSPFWYTVDTAGKVVPYYPYPGAPSYEDPSIVNYLKSKGILVMPTINSGTAGNTSNISAILNNSTARADLENQIVQIVDAKGYDGVDLNFENLRGTDREANSTFVSELAALLHAKGKKVAVDVYPKTVEPGWWDGTQSQDWTVLGNAADEIRINLYDYHWAGTGPGALAPLGWINEVMAFAFTKIPKAKIVHGVGLYGYDWGGATVWDGVWQDVMAKARNYGATIRWDTTDQAPWFEYTAGSEAHTVWFENASSSDVKFGLANQHGVAGVHLWRLGGEDPGTWPVLRSRFGGVIVPPTADIKANGSEGPIAVSYNTAATISWTSANADTCTVAPPGWTGTSNSGIGTGNLTSATTYTLTCTGAGTSVADSVLINIASGDTEAPTVAITSPLPGATLGMKSQKITATARDNVGVTKVQFWGDSTLIATDTSSPYSANWGTRKLTSGTHTITVKAFDAVGNFSTAIITVYKNPTASLFERFLGTVIRVF